MTILVASVVFGSGVGHTPNIKAKECPTRVVVGSASLAAPKGTDGELKADATEFGHPISSHRRYCCRKSNDGTTICVEINIEVIELSRATGSSSHGAEASSITSNDIIERENRADCRLSAIPTSILDTTTPFEFTGVYSRLVHPNTTNRQITGVTR